LGFDLDSGLAQLDGPDEILETRLRVDAVSGFQRIRACHVPCAARLVLCDSELSWRDT